MQRQIGQRHHRISAARGELQRFVSWCRPASRSALVKPKPRCAMRIDLPKLRLRTGSNCCRPVPAANNKLTMVIPSREVKISPDAFSGCRRRSSTATWRHHLTLALSCPRTHARNHHQRPGRPSGSPLSPRARPDEPDRAHPAPASAVRRHDEQSRRAQPLLHVQSSAASRCCGSISAASGAARASSTTGRASCRTRRPRSTGCRSSSPDARACWIVGFSFGTWIAMQLLMRRPEIDGFVCVAPPANIYDFSFLAPCPSSGLMVNGEKDRVVPSASVAELAAKTKTQRGIKIEHAGDPRRQPLLRGREQGRSHGRTGRMVGNYVDERMVEILERSGRRSRVRAGNGNGQRATDLGEAPIARCRVLVPWQRL